MRRFVTLLVAAIASWPRTARSEDTFVATAYVGDRPQPHAGTFARLGAGAGFGYVHVPQSEGVIVRVGAAMEDDLACGLRDGWSLEIGCGYNDLFPGTTTLLTDPHQATDYAVHGRIGWNGRPISFEAGAIARSDSLRDPSLRRDWLVAPDVVLRFANALGDLSFGGGAYDTLTLHSPGLYVRARWTPSSHAIVAVAMGEHEVGLWGEHPHLRIDFDALARIGPRTHWLLGGGFAVLRGGARNVTTTTGVLHLSAGIEI